MVVTTLFTKSPTAKKAAKEGLRKSNAVPHLIEKDSNHKGSHEKFIRGKSTKGYCTSNVNKH